MDDTDRGWIGVVSDTHGLVRPELLELLQGAELILHAGDVGSATVLEQLGQIAPVIAVRGNVDRGAWADQLPELWEGSWRGLTLRMAHQIDALNDLPWSEGEWRIAGHSHRPILLARRGGGVLNPGSAGPRRFRLPISLARLRWRGGLAEAEPLTLWQERERPWDWQAGAPTLC